MGTLSTHVLDTSLGMPARGVRVTLESTSSPSSDLPAGDPLGTGITDDDGRVAAIGPDRLESGDYRLRFDTGSYFAATHRTGFYPEVVIVFTVAEQDEHHHVPVLLAPYGYSTYRGS